MTEESPGMLEQDQTRAAVLVLDDRELIDALTVLLERTGYVIAAVVDRGLQAVEEMAGSPADVVIIDIALLGMLGLRLLGVLRVVCPDAFLIVIDTLGTTGRRVVEAGADAVVGGFDLAGVHRALLAARSPDRVRVIHDAEEPGSVSTKAPRS